MPIHMDDTLPADSKASTSSISAPPTSLTTEEVFEKFKRLNADALDEGERSDLDEEEEDGIGEDVVTNGDGEGEGGFGERGKKKKKKKKEKASKAVAKLKSVLASVKPANPLHGREQPAD